MLNTIYHRLPAYILIALLTCGGPFLMLFLQSKSYVQEIFWPQTQIGFWNGEATSKFDKHYKEAFPIKQFSVTLLNTISYVAFHEARKGAVIGQNGWIFTDEEFVWRSTSTEKVQSNITEILEINDQLKAQGVRLSVILVPQKSVIYQEELGQIRVPLEQQHLYETVRQTLREHGDIIVPDLKSAFLEAKSGQRLFLGTDTHWTAGGASIAASVIANAVPRDLIGNVQNLKRTAALPIRHSGDLLKFVNLGRWSEFLPVREETVVPIAATSVDATVDEFLGAPDVAQLDKQIVLVGTSYSANPLWSFQAQLELALGSSVINRAEEGKGYAAPMRSFLKSSKHKLESVRLVIWEIPVRYLVTDQTEVE
jgi:alginate O-acetyltransferase complex protein AlgJ